MRSTLERSLIHNFITHITYYFQIQGDANARSPVQVNA